MTERTDDEAGRTTPSRSLTCVRRAQDGAEVMFFRTHRAHAWQRRAPVAHRLDRRAQPCTFFNPAFHAYTAACVRSLTPSLASTLLTWVLTVFSPIPNRSAMTPLLMPSAISASTSCSRWLSDWSA